MIYEFFLSVQTKEMNQRSERLDRCSVSFTLSEKWVGLGCSFFFFLLFFLTLLGKFTLCRNIFWTQMGQKWHKTILFNCVCIKGRKGIAVRLSEL